MSHYLLESLGLFGSKNGAEAIVDLVNWNGELAISKTRLAKNYRKPELDKMLRSRRTREESIILHAAKIAGVSCPELYFSDPDKCEIVMEYVKGTHLKDLAHESSSTSLLFKLLGETVANMHCGRIIHGDLTTKNILVKERRIFLIDFGLSFVSERMEDRADDLHLLKQALKASSSRSVALYMSQVFKGYEKIMGPEHRRMVEHQVLEIEKRGRYARVD